MNAVANVQHLAAQNEITMTSLQIVDYVNAERQQVEDFGGKRYVELLHKNFMSKVPTVLGEEASAKFLAHVDVVVGGGAVRQSPAYVFPKREASLMAMSYSYALQARVWDEMTRLEEQVRQTPAVAIPTTFAEALRLAADKAEEVERAQALLLVKDEQLAIAAPKVEFVDRYVEDDALYTFREVAKMLQANERQLRQLLEDKNIMYKLNKTWTARTAQINAGRFAVKITDYSNHTQIDTKFTTKGFDYVQRLWNNR